jgi:hypothetical protein
MVGDQNRRDSSIVNFLKRSDYRMSCVEFIVGRDFRLFHNLRDGHGAMEIVSMGSPAAGDRAAGLSPCGGILRMRVRHPANRREGKSPTTRVDLYSNRLPRSVKLEQQPAFVNGGGPG